MNAPRALVSDIDQAAILRQELAERREEHGHLVYLQISEDEAADIAAGSLPQVVIAQARYALYGFDEQVRTNALKPERKGSSCNRGDVVEKSKSRHRARSTKTSRGGSKPSAKK